MMVSEDTIRRVATRVSDLETGIERVMETLKNETPEVFDTGVKDTVWVSPTMTLYEYCENLLIADNGQRRLF